MNILGKLKISKNSGGSSNYPGGLKVIHRTAQTAFVRGTQREYSSKPLKHNIVKRILEFKR